jgi:predicted AAA+ superfamily ATPase
MEALVHPFSFREFLRHLGREPAIKPARRAKAQRSALERDLRLYLAHGGFPEAVTLRDARDRRDLLRSYVDVALLRDVIERHEVTHPVALRWLSRHLLSNAAGLFSVSKMLGDLKSQGLPVGKDTLHAYLAHLEDAFLIRTLPVATGSERRRMVNPRKAYPVDPGLIPLFDRMGRENLGHALETCVMLELERRGADLGYVRTAEGFEVDFLARYADGSEELIQVCADLDAPATRERELRALEAAKCEHPDAAMRVVSLAPEAPRELPRGVRHSAASAWLLGE